MSNLESKNGNSNKDLVISTTGLKKSFNGKTVIKSLDLKVPKNSIFGFLGPNGSGKTTTMKMMLGLLKPTGGSIKIFGLEVTNNGIDIRRRIGYLAQHPRYYNYMTPREILRFRARFFYKGPKTIIENRITDSLQITGLEDIADRTIKGFSGGERQRLGMAQAQVNRPELLILDEPAASLDPMGRHDVLKIMESLREHSTIFYSTHILDDVEKVSDTVAIVNNGELITQAPIEELLRRESTVFKFVLKGTPIDAYDLVSKQPWVSAIAQERNNGRTTWEVLVSDENLAEDHLLPLVFSDNKCKIVEYGLKKFDLEEIFLNLVQEEK